MLSKSVGDEQFSSFRTAKNGQISQKKVNYNCKLLWQFQTDDTQALG